MVQGIHTPSKENLFNSSDFNSSIVSRQDSIQKQGTQSAQKRQAIIRLEADCFINDMQM